MKFQSLVVVAGMAGCVCGVNESDKSGNVGATMGGVVAAVLKAQQDQNSNNNSASRPQ